VVKMYQGLFQLQCDAIGKLKMVRTSKDHTNRVSAKALAEFYKANDAGLLATTIRLNERALKRALGQLPSLPHPRSRTHARIRTQGG
jgi:hypothetical protein